MKVGVGGIIISKITIIDCPPSDSAGSKVITFLVDFHLLWAALYLKHVVQSDLFRICGWTYGASETCQQRDTQIVFCSII